MVLRRRTRARARAQTRTAPSLPYKLVLPGPAGFDISTSLWLTEALALGRAPGASALHSALLLACWFTVPGGCLLIHFPSQFAHRAPRKPSSSNIFALWFPEEPMKKNKASRSLHLFQLMCTGPVSFLCSRPPGEEQRAAVSQAPCGCSISPTASQAGTRRGAAARGTMAEPITCMDVCQVKWGPHRLLLRVHY